MIFVWMELERQFPVCFLELFIANVFTDSQHLVVVFTPFYTGGQEQTSDVIRLNASTKVLSSWSTKGTYVQKAHFYFYLFKQRCFNQYIVYFTYIVPIHNRNQNYVHRKETQLMNTTEKTL